MEKEEATLPSIEKSGTLQTSLEILRDPGSEEKIDQKE